MSVSVKSVIPEGAKFYFRLDNNNNIQKLRVKEKSSTDPSGTDKKVATIVVTLFEEIETAPKKPIQDLKDKLEALIKDENGLGKDLRELFQGQESLEKEFQIIFAKDGIKLQRKTIKSGSKEKKLTKISSREFLSKIDEIYSYFITHITFHVPKLKKIVTHTAEHNIVQLKAAPNANKTYTKLLLTALTIGLLAGIIGIGAIMPHLGIASLTALGIPGISTSIAIPLLGIGALTLGSLMGLKISSKSSEKSKNYLDAMFLLKSKLFLESNLNDFTNSALFLLMTLTLIKDAWLTTLKGCLAYPTGALLIASGLYQLGESIKSMANNQKIGDIKELIISTLNVFSSSTVIAMGILTAIGMINAPITVVIMFIFGALMVTVNAYNLYKSIKQLREINKVDPENETEIYKFLKKYLSIDGDEKQAIKDKIKAMSEPELLKWIEKNLKNFEKEQAQVFEQIKQDLEKAKEQEKRQIIITEIKKLIINEEIKNALESKIERFGSIVNKETLIEALQKYAGYEDHLECKGEQNPGLKELFKKIKKDTTGKTVAEIIKFAIINIPMMVIPSLQNMKLISTTLYNYLMAGGLLSNISVNITPRYRNIPPAVIKRVLDINNVLDNTTYAKYKRKITPISEAEESSTAKKTDSVADIELKEVV